MSWLREVAKFSGVEAFSALLFLQSALCLIGAERCQYLASDVLQVGRFMSG